MVPLLRPSEWSYNQERPTSSGSVPSTRVAVDRSLISQLSRRVCPGSLGPHPPLGSARYVYVRGKRVCVWGEGRKEQACSIVLWSFIFTPSHPHPLPSSQEYRRCSSLLGATSQLGWDHHRILCLPWPQAPARSTARHHGICSCLLWSGQLLRSVPQPAGLCTHRHHLKTCHHLPYCSQE